ncbi:MAG: ornithine cyclodeaminase family protein [Candidatus Binatota bacterium]|nr:ornithine cyclodeaminase family protein [Candidatus Binatota bacterium]
MALLISNQDIEQVLDMKTCLGAIEEGIKEYYRGDAICRPRIDVWAPSGDPKGYYQWGSMEGTSRRYGVFATRIKSDIAYWSTSASGVKTQEKYCQRPGLFCGLILLFSTENGEPLAVMNDGYLQHLRVGATAGIAAKYLSSADADTVGMIGSGGMAWTHALAFAEVRRLKRIQVYSPTPANRDAFAGKLAERLGIEAIPVASAEAAVKGAQIVSACTDATVPVIPGRTVDAGAFICTVKGSVELDRSCAERVRAFYTFAPNTDAAGEAFGAAMSRAQKISGSHRAYVAGQPEELARIPDVQREGGFDKRKVVSFKDLFAGANPGRRDGEEILGVGGNQIQGIQFASVGGATYRLIKDQGLGREFPTDWLLQDIRN